MLTVLLALLAPALCGCEPINNLTAPTAAPVNIFALQTCTRILAPVQLPNVNVETDARDAFVRDDAALQTAIGEINVGRNCISRVMRSYAQPK